VENLVQASANCLLRYALREIDARGVIVVGSVHDEIIAECDANDAEKTSVVMTEIMTTAPSWAKGLPLAVEGDVMLRYAK
jgi:DNA polymerase